MKDAVLGSIHNNSSEDARKILRKAGMQSFKQLAGYVPPTMSVDTPMLPAIQYPFTNGTDAMMTRLCGERLYGCNPRVPYLLFIWLLVASDNQHRLHQYIKDNNVLRRLALLLMRVACGNSSDSATIQDIDNALRLAWVNLNQMAYQKRKADSAFYAVEAAMPMTGIFNFNHIFKSSALFSALTDTIMTRTTKIFSEKAQRDFRQRTIAWCCIEDDVAWRIIQALMVDILTVNQRINP
jgi:hypothetical protein